MTAGEIDQDQSPLRVTHVVFDFNGGGMETLVAEMAARLKGSPVEVSLITMSGRVGRLGEMTRDRFAQFHVTRPSGVKSMIYPGSVAALIRQTRAQVVHTHTGSWFKGARAARIAGIKRVLYTEHGREHFDPLRNRLLDRVASWSTDAVVGVSARLERYMGDAVGVARRKVCTVHNGVDTSTFTPGRASDELCASMNIPKDALVIGSIGRLEKVKAFERLLSAAAQLRGKLARPFVIVLVGDGTERQYLTEYAERLGISDIVRLPGWTKTPVDFYRLLDVFVLSSTSEGQSVSLMEAMSCAIAPVVTDVGGNAELVGADLRSQVVPGEGDDVANHLARAISATVGAPERMAEIGAAVRRRAESAYSLDRMVSNYVRLYRSSGIPEDLRLA